MFLSLLFARAIDLSNQALESLLRRLARALGEHTVVDIPHYSKRRKTGAFISTFKAISYFG